MNEKPLLTLRPNLINAFFPTFIKYVLKIMVYAGVPFLILTSLLKVLGVLKISLLFQIGIIFLASISIAAVSILLKIFVLLPKLEYRFYKNHLEVESKLFHIEKKSVPYNKITNINAKISLWDRLTNAGDLIIHTADEKETGDIHLLFIKDPLKIEKEIHSLIVKVQKN